MAAERAQKLESLFALAAELNPQAREAFFSAECAEDPSLRAEIESLLAADERAGRFIEHPALAAVAAAGVQSGEADESQTEAERRIGPYRTMRRIGVGGMGAVYLAARDDDQFKQLVAVKIIRRGMDHEEIIRRFRHERQILAGLNHPNIARLLDGGATEDGLPWFALEYVDGQPLTEYCDRQRLSIHQRLQLFLTVCAAVQHAHRNLVIHRDLKPGNILITADGAPKLLDFGIAKLLHSSGADETLGLTVTGMKLMTPAYASPEQARGETITTATDVYSLGVILYELLTHRRPYHVTGRMAEREVARVICEQEPAKPSLMITRREAGEPADPEPARLARQLRGDLDNIALKALSKEPSRRYSSVEQFAEDIRRHLSGRTIQARPATLAYRGAKFVRRNKGLALAAALIVASLVAGILATARQARIARAQAEQAGKERKKAERISAYLQNVFSYAEPNAAGPGGGRRPEVKLEDALRDAEKRIEGELKAEPETRAELHITLGKVWQMRGDFASAEAHFRQSLALRRQLHGERHPQIARSLFFLSQVLYQQGQRPPPNEDPNHQALVMMRELDPGNDLLPWMALNDGSRAGNRGDFPAGEAGILEAQRLFRDRYGDRHNYTLLTTVRLAELYKQRGELDRARAAYRDYLDRSSHLSPDAERANALGNIGIIEFWQGQDAAAEKRLHESLAVFHEYLGDDHPHTLGVRQTLASLYARRADLDRAETEARHALGIARSKYPPDSSFVVSALLVFGKILTERGNARQAAPLLREAVEKARQRRASTSRQASAFAGISEAGILGECLTLLKRYEDAENMLKENYNGLLTMRGVRSPELLEARRRLAQLYDAWGKPELAAQFR